MASMMEKIFGIRSREEIPIVCNYCNSTLIAPYGLVVKTTYLSDYGAVCSNCVKGLYVIKIYIPGEDVSETLWYRGCYLD